jgi:hypothetical protein
MNTEPGSSPEGAFDGHGDAQRAAESLQRTIRHADAKASGLLGALSGMVATAADAVATPDHPAGSATLMLTVTMLAAAKAGWHLLAAIRPRFAFPPPKADPSRDGVLGWYTESDRLPEGLWRIAVVKHGEVARSIPCLFGTGVAAGFAMGLAIARHLW